MIQDLWIYNLGVLEEKDPLDLSNEIAAMIEDFHKNIP